MVIAANINSANCVIAPLTFLHLVPDTGDSPVADWDQYSLLVCMSYAKDPVQTQEKLVLRGSFLCNTPCCSVSLLEFHQKWMGTCWSLVSKLCPSPTPPRLGHIHWSHLQSSGVLPSFGSQNGKRKMVPQAHLQAPAAPKRQGRLLGYLLYLGL